jgi:uncharacterized protein
MELTTEFLLDVPGELAWDVLTDLERIAPVVPGVELAEVDGDELRGRFTVELSSRTVTWEATVRLVEVDGSARRAVVRADGVPTGRGADPAAPTGSTVTARLVPAAGGTTVSLVVATGAGGTSPADGEDELALAVDRLVEDFVVALRSEVLGGGARPSASDPEAPPAPPGGAGAATTVPDAGAAAGAPSVGPATPAPPGASPGSGTVRHLHAPEWLPDGAAGRSVRARGGVLAGAVAATVLGVALLRWRRRGSTA